MGVLFLLVFLVNSVVVSAAELRFQPGFNLFSYPGEPPANLFCTSLQAQLGAETLKRYDAPSQSFSDCGTSTDFPVVAGQGYIASFLASGVFSVSGPATCPLLDLSAGINLISVPTPVPGLSCYDLLQALGGPSEVSGVQRFDSGPGRFLTCSYDRLDPAMQPLGDNFPIQSGDAYWISMRNAVTGVQLNDTSQCAPPIPSPVINDFSPKSGPVGTLVTLSGANFAPSSTLNPAVTMAKFGGGRIRAPIASFDDTEIVITVPTGADTGLLEVQVGMQSAASGLAFTLVASSDFTIAAVPASGELIQGQSVNYSVELDTTNGFAGLATLHANGLPAGISANFNPPQIAAGQQSLLTLTAASGQAPAATSFQVTASADIDGITLNQTVDLSVNVVAETTSFVGRVVVADPQQTPLEGVTVTLLGLDGSGNATGCTGQTVSDASGNFSFTNLPPACVGDQLIRYDGLTVTNQPGDYAGVDLVYTLTSGQVTVSPVLIHLPRIDNQETVMVIQNHTLDQTFRFATIPNLSVTVYAGTVLTMPDGSQPDPFPLIAVNVPIDRLPDEMPPSNTVDPFIVAFQPANAEASQPVAVTFPNVLNFPPGTSVTLMTLDPTKGVMVPYGTGTVSNDGLKIVPDLDPANPGKRFGLVHFDWHGPAGPAPNQTDPCPNGPCGGDPVHFASGLVVEQQTDIAIPAPGGGISIQRTYRTLSANAGPFGIGGNHNYSYFLNLSNPSPTSPVINFIVPAGNQFPMTNNGAGIFTNTSEPSLRGAVLEVNSDRTSDLTFKDGTVFHFVPGTFLLGSVLQSITDLNGNRTTLVRNPSNLLQISEIIDSVGRKLRLSYDSGNRITRVTDPIGRNIDYTYTSFGRLETVTDPEGGVTRYSYVRPTPSTEANLIESITDARGVVIARNFYGLVYGPSCAGATGLNPDELAAMPQSQRDACLNDSRTITDQRVWKQIAADGGEMLFKYTLSNAAVALSPVIKTAVTDAMGNTTTYRFSPQGQLLDATDPLGQTMIFDRDPGSNQLLGKRGNATCELCGDIRSGDVSMTRDANGNILTLTDALGNVSSIAYDSRFNQPVSVIDALGNTTSFVYDARGNLVSAIDANGNTVAISFSSRGLPTDVTNALGDKTSFEYDALGNLVKTTDTVGNITQFSYDAVGRLIETVDAEGRRTTVVYDDLDRIVKQTDAKGGVTTLAYDVVGNLLSVTDARGNTVSFSYNAMNRVSNRMDPLGASETFGYDLNGNLISATDRRGQLNQYAYDILNRLITETYADGSFVDNSYDARGRVIRVADSIGGVQTFQYDSLGRLVMETGVNGTVDYQYDANSRMLTREILGQQAVNYTYDALGNLLSASDPNGNVDFTYDALNRRTGLQRSNGVDTIQTFDALGRVLSIAHSNSNGTLDHQTYSYDKLGNRKSLDNTLGQAYVTQSANATFDAANRLLQRDNITYSYDANGNRISKTEPQGTTNYTWDSRDRLTSISEPNGTVTQFVYDAFNNLISQQSSGSTINLETDYLVDDLTNVIRQTNSNGESFAIMTGRDSDDHLIVRRNNGIQEYIARDSINSTVAITDSTGLIIQSFSYEPYGATSGASTGFPIQFTGRMPVADDLYYYRARFYDPKTGRFLSEDPLDLLAGDLNLYRYVFNSPLSYRDPSGQIVPLIFAGAAIGALINGGVQVGINLANGRNITSGLGGAVVSGAISGAVGAVAGPLGGTIARGLGGRAAGLLPRLLSTGISAAGGALGQAAQNTLDPCNSGSIANAALFSGAGGLLASFLPNQGLRTLAQARYFAPRRIGSILRSPGAGRAAIVSSSIGAAAAFGGPF